MGGTRTEIVGFIDAWEGHDWQGVFPIFANATPAGKVTGETFEHVANTMLDCLKNHGPFDSVCLALHRAMVCTHVDDGKGKLLRRFGDVVGQDIPIVMTLDLHANITDQMAELLDIIVIYRTYSHVDEYEISSEAAELLQRTFAGDIKPKT